MSQTLPNMLEKTIAKIREMVDVNSVIGNPITTPDGTVVIPVSKVSVGFAGGGSDFASKVNPKLCFGGGSGAGVTIKPVSFLVISPAGTVNVLPAEQGTVSSVEKIIDMAPSVIEQIKEAFKKNKDEDDE